ncbi:protein phosphatase 1 regulatory subunit 32 [Gymnogyps californianus]|uniref:protein phosphatase 1 regulatory subunit 32 n=1 Tax=Gymnogyps californianus TaxID=33616 RepID=UPI0021C9D7A1|nr:protein phosphatase 1 regulatory subunit 32 [Gymnogyps californianus]
MLDIPQPPLPPGPPGRQGVALQDSPTMASACPFVCPRAKLLLQDSPAAGLGTVSPSAKACTGGSADLMNFYATSYAVAHGQPHFRPHLGHHTSTGYVSNNQSAISCLLCPCSAAEGHCQDTATSTAAEHFKPLWLPDGQSLLPRHIHQPGSGYLQESSLSCLRTGAVSPQQTRFLQDPPKTSREHGTESCRAGPAQPDVLQKTTIGTKEQSGFTRATPRSNSILPALPGQPLGISITTTDYLPSVRSHGGETLPVLPAGSERGSGFSREVPGCVGTAGLPAVGHPIPLISRGLQAPRVTQASRLGQQGAGRKEPSGFTTNHGQYVTPHPTLSPTVPARCWRDPTWTARPVGGIQPQRPSGFSTNNRPTGLGDIVGHLPA